MYLLYYNQNWKSLLKYHSHSEESANVREDEGIWKSRLSSLMNEFEETGYIPVQKKNQLTKDVNYKNLRLFSSFSMYKASLQCSWDAEAPFRLKAVAKTRERGPFFAVVERNSNTASSRLNSSLLIDFILLSLAKKWTFPKSFSITVATYPWMITSPPPLRRHVGSLTRISTRSSSNSAFGLRVFLWPSLDSWP